MNFEKFSKNIDSSWHTHLQPLIEGKECDEVYADLKKRAKEGEKITPYSENTWKAFRETKSTDLKAVVVGMCPYHTMKKGILVADGLALSCSNTGELQPSLEKYYQVIEKEIYDGFNLRMTKDPDLSFLANQGVLLLNSALTTTLNSAGKHQLMWLPLMSKLVKMLSTFDVPFIFLGKQAQNFNGFAKTAFNIEHPAAACYAERDWDSQGAFKQVTEIVKRDKDYTILWDNEPPFD